MTSRLRIFALPLLVAAVLSSETGQAQMNATGQSPEVTRPELQAAAGQSAAFQFYNEIGWRAVWTDAAEAQLRAALADRTRHGMDRLRFLSEQIGEAADREIHLTRAALAYAESLAAGYVDPHDLHAIYTISVPGPDLASGLASALKNGALREWLEGLAPQDEAYAALSDAYLRYREQGQKSANLHIGDGPLIREGESDPRVPRLAELLRHADYLQPSSKESTGEQQAAKLPVDLYTPRLKRAVERLQADHGIAVDGIVGPDTIEILNMGPEDRAQAAAVAMERRRWLVRNPPPQRIDVNTASTMLAYYRDGVVVDRRKTIAGQPGWETPPLQSDIYRLVANPTWTVPRSIEEDELAGVGAAGLRERNMTRRGGWIVQKSGPRNALGLVKFDMDNDHAIYLHDTPAKSLFDRNLRNLSHGCVRVQDALGFASMLVRHAGLEEEWQDARASGVETFLRLPEHIPVRLLYHPTFVAPSGAVRFTWDVYGWNDPVAERLGFGKSKRRQSPAGFRDLGP